MTFREMEEKVRKHLEDRGWDKLRPSDVSKSIMIEGAELLELFQWENLPLDEVKNDPEKVKEIAKELADVLIYGFEMAALLGIDTEAVINEKLEHVAKKYPAELMRSSTAEPGSGRNAEYWRIKKEYRRKAAET